MVYFNQYLTTIGIFNQYLTTIGIFNQYLTTIAEDALQFAQLNELQI
jgi:hypothetical protein